MVRTFYSLRERSLLRNGTSSSVRPGIFGRKTMEKGVMRSFAEKRRRTVNPLGNRQRLDRGLD